MYTVIGNFLPQAIQWHFYSIPNPEVISEHEKIEKWQKTWFLFPYKIYTNIKKHQNNKETKYRGKDRKANKAWWFSIPEKKKK